MVAGVVSRPYGSVASMSCKAGVAAAGGESGCVSGRFVPAACNGDSYLQHPVLVTLKVTAVSTGVALLVGLPLDALLGLGRFRGHSVALVVANAGLSLKPVLVVLVLALLMFPRAPLGHLHRLPLTRCRSWSHSPVPLPAASRQV